MAEEKKDPWLNYLALTTVILAVCATLSTFKGGSFSTRSVLSQTQAANQWAYYQAKGIKSYLYEIQKEKLELELEHQEDNGLSSKAIESHKKTILSYTARIDKYNAEKAAIEKEARRLEVIRDDAQKHAQVFGIAVIFLQIAILLSSVAALMKKEELVWFLGVLMGIGGIVYFADGFLLFFSI